MLIVTPNASPTRREAGRWSARLGKLSIYRPSAPTFQYSLLTITGVGQLADVTLASRTFHRNRKASVCRRELTGVHAISCLQCLQQIIEPLRITTESLILTS